MSLRHSRSVAVALVTCATFTDIVAYSIAVPVLPDLSQRLGATPTMIGLLFGSLRRDAAGRVGADGRGVRPRRPAPAARGRDDRAGAASALFAVARSLPWLFAARLVQGAADGVTWVVGFALIADLYGPDERGRVMGYVMSGTSVALLVGPSIGGWLYAMGGIELPFVVRGRRCRCLRAWDSRDPAGAGRREAARRRRRGRSCGRPPSPSARPTSSSWARRSRCSNRCCRCSSAGGSACRRRRSACCSAPRPAR